MSNYYAKRDAKVRIAHELMNRGWEVFGYKKDESDSMTDYYSPADWDGIATKNGYTLVIDNRSAYYSNKEITKFNPNYKAMSNSDYNKIESLKNMTQANGATEGEERNAKSLIEKINSKYDDQECSRYEVTGHYPEYMANSKGSIWHIEKDGALFDKGNSLTKFANVPESYVYDINKMEFVDRYKTYTSYNNETRQPEQVERTLSEDEEKAIKALKNFILRIERAVNGMNTCGDGTAETEKAGLEQQSNETMVRKIVKKTKKVWKMIEVKRDYFKVGDYVTLPHHGHFWKIIREADRKGKWNGVEDTRHTFTYEIVGSASRGYKDLKSAKRYYNWEHIMLKQLQEGTAKIYELKQVEEIEEVEKWVKVKAKKNNKTTPKTTTKKENNETKKSESVENSSDMQSVTIIEDVHTKTGEQLFIVKLDNKVSKDEFKTILSNIKSIGGYYSKFKSGFIFKEEPSNETLESINLTIDINENEIEENINDKENNNNNSNYDQEKIEEGYIYDCHFKEWNYTIDELKKLVEGYRINYIDMGNKIGFENLRFVDIEIIKELSNDNGSILFIDNKLPVTNNKGLHKEEKEESKENILETIEHNYKYSCKFKLNSKTKLNLQSKLEAWGIDYDFKNNYFIFESLNTEKTKLVQELSKYNESDLILIEKVECNDINSQEQNNNANIIKEEFNNNSSTNENVININNENIIEVEIIKDQPTEANKTIAEINTELEIINLRGNLKFLDELGLGYYKPKGFTLFHKDYGYYTMDNITPYIPLGGETALKEILNQGGFTEFNSNSWVQPIAS